MKGQRLPARPFMARCDRSRWGVLTCRPAHRRLSLRVRAATAARKSDRNSLPNIYRKRCHGRMGMQRAPDARGLRKRNLSAGVVRHARVRHR